MSLQPDKNLSLYSIKGKKTMVHADKEKKNHTFF